MSRIIAGVAGGRPLTSVATDATRPTTDRVKEALFSRLESWGVIDGAVVLDLFAGSGALGCEAASRGAARVTLVDSAPAAITASKANARLVNDERGRNVIDVRRASVATFLAAGAQGDVDLALLDPPYPMGEDEIEGILVALVPWMAGDSVVVLERSKRSAVPRWPEGLRPLRERSYGESTLWFAERAEGVELEADQQA